MRIDETGNQRPIAQFHHPGGFSDQCPNLVCLSDRDDLLATNRDRVRARGRVVHGVNVLADKDGIGGRRRLRRRFAAGQEKARCNNHPQQQMLQRAQFHYLASWESGGNPRVEGNGREHSGAVASSGWVTPSPGAFPLGAQPGLRALGPTPESVLPERPKIRRLPRRPPPHDGERRFFSAPRSSHGPRCGV